MSLRHFFTDKIEGAGGWQKTAEFCFTPLRGLFGGRKVKVLNTNQTSQIKTWEGIADILPLAMVAGVAAVVLTPLGLLAKLGDSLSRLSFGRRNVSSQRRTSLANTLSLRQPRNQSENSNPVQVADLPDGWTQSKTATARLKKSEVFQKDTAKLDQKHTFDKHTYDLPSNLDHELLRNVRLNDKPVKDMNFQSQEVSSEKRTKEALQHFITFCREDERNWSEQQISLVSLALMQQTGEAATLDAVGAQMGIFSPEKGWDYDQPLRLLAAKSGNPWRFEFPQSPTYLSSGDKGNPEVQVKMRVCVFDENHMIDPPQKVFDLLIQYLPEAFQTDTSDNTAITTLTYTEYLPPK